MKRKIALVLIGCIVLMLLGCSGGNPANPGEGGVSGDGNRTEADIKAGLDIPDWLAWRTFEGPLTDSQSGDAKNGLVKFDTDNISFSSDGSAYTSIMMQVQLSDSLSETSTDTRYTLTGNAPVISNNEAYVSGEATYAIDVRNLGNNRISFSLQQHISYRGEAVDSGLVPSEVSSTMSGNLSLKVI